MVTSWDSQSGRRRHHWSVMVRKHSVNVLYANQFGITLDSVKCKIGIIDIIFFAAMPTLCGLNVDSIDLFWIWSVSIVTSASSSASPLPHLCLTFASPLPHLCLTFASPSASPLPHLCLTFASPLPHLLPHLCFTSASPLPHLSLLSNGYV